METKAISQHTQQRAFTVYLRGKHIDTVFYTGNVDRQEVKDSLVNHDNYNPNIIVRKQRN